MKEVENIITKIENEVIKTKSSIPPKFIFIGGIPGSGKNLLVEKAKKNFCDDIFNVVDVDIYRKYFLSSKTIDETITSSNKIEIAILNSLIRNRKNIIHIGTLRAYNYIDEMIRTKLIPLNYEIYFYILITNRIESAISTYERYIVDKRNKNVFPRLNKLNYLDRSYTGFKNAINFFEGQEYFDDHNVRLFIRGKNMSLPILINAISNDILTSIEIEEQRQLNELNKSLIDDRINYIFEKLNTFDEKEEFNKIIENIIYSDKFTKVLKRGRYERNIK